MASLAHDIRNAFRSLLRRPGFTAVLIVTLALGIGANSAIFSFVHAVLLRPLPFAEPSRLMKLWTVLPNWGHESASYPDYRDWVEETDVFERATAYANTNLNLAPLDGEPERIPAALVTGDFFGTLGIRPPLGRGFGPEDEVYGNHQVIVLSDALWRRSFGADPGVVGRTVTVNALSYIVVGVAPPGFWLPERAQVWTPLAFNPANPPPHRRSDFLHVVARLKPSATEARAQAELDGLARRLEDAYPDTNAGVGVDVVSLHRDLVGEVRTALLVFAGAVGLVLLIACANVANLLLARATARDREMAVRTALGASRLHLVRMLLAESVLVAMLGGAGGLVLAVWGVRGLRALVPETLPRLADVGVNPVVLGFTALLALATGIAFGLAPALRGSARATGEALKSAGRGSIGGPDRLRAGLVLAQVALALTLLAGAGLLARSFQRLQRVELGFDERNVLAAVVYLPAARYREDNQVASFFGQLGDRLRSTAGIRTVGFSTDIPLQRGYGYNTFAVIGRPPPAPGEPAPDAVPTSADPGFFDALGIPLLEGRMFGPEDRPGSPRVVLVNQEMVRRHFEGRTPVGERVTWSDPADSSTWRTIVGVVGSTRLEGVGQASYPQIYMPLSQTADRARFVVARTLGDPLALVPALRREIAALDPVQPLADVRSMAGRVDAALAQPRVSSYLVGGFALFALLLASIGIYGVLAYTVAQRTREMGIRMALGASRVDVLRLVVREGMRPVVVGVALGLALAFAATRLMTGLLFEVPAADPIVFGAVTAVLALVGLLACWVPARRAAAVEPMQALRDE